MPNQTAGAATLESEAPAARRKILVPFSGLKALGIGFCRLYVCEMVERGDFPACVQRISTNQLDGTSRTSKTGSRHARLPASFSKPMSAPATSQAPGADTPHATKSAPVGKIAAQGAPARTSGQRIVAGERHHERRPQSAALHDR